MHTSGAYFCAVLVLVFASAENAPGQIRINGMSKKDYFSTTYLDMARQARDRGNYQEALAECQKALQYNPKMAMAYYTMGDVYSEIKQYENAVKAFQSAAAFHDRKKEPLLFYYANWQVGEMYRVLGRFEEARAAYLIALAWQPRTDREKEDYRRVNRGMGLTWRGIGLAHYDKGSYQEAATAVQQALKYNPDALTHSLLGTVYDNLGQTQAALSEFLSAAQLADPKQDRYEYYDAQYEAGRMYVKLKQNDRALAAFRVVLQLQPANEKEKSVVVAAAAEMLPLEEAAGAAGSLRPPAAAATPAPQQRKNQVLTPNDCALIGSILGVAAQTASFLADSTEDVLQKQVAPQLALAAQELRAFSFPDFSRDTSVLDSMVADIQRNHAAGKREYPVGILKLMQGYLLDDVEQAGKGYRWYLMLGFIVTRLDAVSLALGDQSIVKATSSAVAAIADWAKYAPADAPPPLMGALQALASYAPKTQLSAADRQAIAGVRAYIASGMWQWSKDPYQPGKTDYAPNNGYWIERSAGKPAPAKPANPAPAGNAIVTVAIDRELPTGAYEPGDLRPGDKGASARVDLSRVPGSTVHYYWIAPDGYVEDDGEQLVEATSSNWRSNVPYLHFGPRPGVWRMEVRDKRTGQVLGSATFRVLR